MKTKKKTHENITVVIVRFVCSKFSESVHFTFDVFFQIFAMFLPPICKMMQSTHTAMKQRRRKKTDDEKVRAHKIQCSTEDAIFIGAENLLNIQRF